MTRESARTSNPPLLILNAGYGETPICEVAKFARGDVVRVSRRKHLARIPDELIVLIAVPPGFPAEYALADALKEPRPLMISKSSRAVSYILCREGDTKPYHLHEADLRATDRKVEIGILAREAS